MVKTFIYGNPHGFNFYERDESRKDYFMAFYISSRKGRRLMVHRNEDGETLYSYLHYGLQEAVDRPTNSFMGMTIVLDGGEFCADFKKLFEWFDHIFEKIVERGVIFQKRSEGNIKYRIHDFAAATDEVEWIKSNLPKILSPQAGTKLFPYDNSFQWIKTGQVAAFPIEIENNKLLSAFRSSRWIAISPEFRVAESGGKDVYSSVEFVYADLMDRLNELTSVLLPISIGTAKATLGQLNKMTDECRLTSRNIALYLKGLTNKDECKRFEELYTKYNALSENLKVLIEKEQTPDQPLPEPYQPISNQPKLSDITPPRPGDKKCMKCGAVKPIADFEKNNDECKQCLAETETKTKGFSISPKLIGIIVTGIILVSLGLFLSSDDKRSESQAKPVIASTQEESEGQGAKSNNTTDNYRDYLKKNLFDDAVACLNEKAAESPYKEEIESAIVNYLLQSIMQGDKETEIHSKLIPLRQITEIIGWNYFDKQEYWTSLANKYHEEFTILAKDKISNQEKLKCEEINNNYLELRNLFAETLATKQIQYLEPTQKVSDIQSISFSIQRLDKDNKPKGNAEILKGGNQEVKSGNNEKVRITCTQPMSFTKSDDNIGATHTDEKKIITINLEKAGWVTCKCGNTSLTITIKQQLQKF